MVLGGLQLNKLHQGMHVPTWEVLEKLARGMNAPPWELLVYSL